MRILFIVPYVPNRIRTRPYNLIRALAAEGHDLTILTLTGDGTELDDMRELQNYVSRVISFPLSRTRSLANVSRALVNGKPLQAAYCRHPDLAAALQTLLREEIFDVVHVEHLRGAQYALLAKKTIAETDASTPVVWDSVDCISHLFRQASHQSTSRFNRMVTRFDLPRTERYEGRLVSAFDMVLTTSSADRDALSDLAAAAGSAAGPIHVLSNGVDLCACPPDPAVTRDPATLILSGKMSYHANVTMAIYLAGEVMPLVWRRRPDVRVMIVGKDPHPAVLALQSDPRITVTGTVPDIRPYLAKATIAVAPIVYSAGVQNKILEAMACATPVVTTDQVVSALKANPGEHFLACRSAGEFADCLNDLLNSQERRRRIGQAGRQYVEQNHDWAKITRRLIELYQIVGHSRSLHEKDGNNA